LSETCSLADMLESAILLAQHRNPAYWHDAERYVHNHLLVHQIIDTGWEKDMTPTSLEKHALRYPGDTLPAAEGAVRGATVMPTLIGGFAGWGGVTALSDDSMFGNSNQHCCNAAGARALYDAWHYAVTDKGGVLDVNLHVHRNHAAAEIVAAEALQPAPALAGLGNGDEAGGLLLKIKQRRRLKVRIPEFVTAPEVQANVNGRTVAATQDGPFVDLGFVDPGDAVEVLYPLKARTTAERIAPGLFTFRWRGATVVAASPEQKIRPLFNDARFLASPPEIGLASGHEIEPV